MIMEKHFYDDIKKEKKLEKLFCLFYTICLFKLFFDYHNYICLLQASGN